MSKEIKGQLGTITVTVSCEIDGNIVTETKEYKGLNFTPEATAASVVAEILYHLDEGLCTE